MAHRRRPSPPRSQRMHDHRASTGSLQQPPPENMFYGGGQPMAPAPPGGLHHGHLHRGPYSSTHSPQGSSEDLNMGYGYPQSVPPTPGYPSPGWMGMGHPIAGMMAPGPPQNMAPAPGPPPPPPPPPGMRGGDGHARMGSLGRRNTQNEKPHRPNIIHQQHHSQPAPAPPPDYSHEHQEFDYRQPPRRGAPTNRESRSSSRSRDASPPGAGPYVVPGHSMGGRPPSTYHSGSSDFSAESYNDFPEGRQQSYVVPNASHGPGNPREYHLGGPLPGERGFREGTVYHPNGGNRPVLEEQRQRQPRRERSMSRGPHHGLGLMDGDGFEEDYRSRRAPSTTNANEKGALVRARSRSVPASDSRAMIPQQRSRPSSETSESSSSSEAAAEPSQSQIRIEYDGRTIDINYNSRKGKSAIGNITINTTSRSHTLPLNPPTNQRAIAAAPQSTPPPAAAAIMPPPAEAAPPAPPPPPPAPEAAPAPAPPPPPPPASVMIPAPPQPTPFNFPAGVEPVVLPPPPQPGIVPPAPGTMAPLRRAPGSDSGVYMDDSDRDPRESFYQNMESLTLKGPSSPPFYREERGRDRDAMSAITTPRSHSRRRRSMSRSRKSVDGNEPRWTKISRDIVARRAVEVIGYEFKEQPDSIMVFQVLDESQIDELIELSQRIRNGEVRVIRRERSPGRDEEKERRHHHRRPSQHRHGHRSRPVSIHGHPSPGPGPSANRPPPGKPALVSTPPVPPAPEPPQAEAPAPPPPRQQAPPKRPQENPDHPGTYIGYTRNPPRSTQSSVPFHRHGKRPT